MRRLFGAACIGFLFAGPAGAEEEVIVVTATRTPTAVSRLPARVEVIDRAEIEARALATVAESLGPSAVQSGAPGATTSVFLRGANSKHTLALLDGVRLNDASNPNAQYEFGQDLLGALERVEVLRAPASSIYGSDALGGAVNLIPRRGAETAFAPFLEAAAGELDLRRATIGAAGSTDAVDYGVSLEWFETDGFDQMPARMALHAGDPDGGSIGTATASARAQLSAGLAFDALLRWREAETEFDSFSAGAMFAQRGDDPDLEASNTQGVWRLGADWDMGAVTWRLAGGQVLFESIESDGAIRTAQAQSLRSFADASARWSPQGADWLHNSAVTLGIAWTHDEADVAGSIFSDPLSEAESARAAYVVAQGDIGRRWSATASARIDDFDGFGAHATYAAGLVGRFGPVRALANLGTAFKAPSLGERFGTGAFNLGNPDLEPEEARSWELGADWAATPTLTLGASYYQTRIENLIEYDFAALRNLNVGRAEIDGAEAFLGWRPAEAVDVRVAYAWTDARDGLTGARLRRRPPHAWRLQARAQPHPRVSAALTWSWIGARTDVTYDDDGFFVSGNGRTPSYDVGDLALTYDVGGVQLFARIENILDEKYEQPAAFAGAPRSALFGVRAQR